MYNKLKDVLPIFTILFALLIALMMSLNVLKTDDGDVIMNGFTAVFGGEVASIGSFASVDVSFNFKNLLAFVSPIVISLLFFVFTRGSKTYSVINMIFSLLLLGAFVFSLIILTNLGAYTEGSASAFGGSVTYTYEGSKLAIGSIFAVVFSIGGIMTTLVNALIQVK